ncbi:hypothetical protein BJ508DRAFT_375371 [Ascobolus immersus RN42]|uniref:Uncharacterized protein n=1 Tax=Ascobolus immersus RN42 TaxID=1160509 RepID=A0A3N4IBP3_ASCIM|nr:hypothetical protein BJ508DRAFT_375371 [Ascobolus immersus RN42]
MHHLQRCRYVVVHFKRKEKGWIKRRRTVLGRVSSKSSIINMFTCERARSCDVATSTTIAKRNGLPAHFTSLIHASVTLLYSPSPFSTLHRRFSTNHHSRPNRTTTKNMSTLPQTPFPPHHLSVTYTLTILLHNLSKLHPYSTSPTSPRTPTRPKSPQEAEILDALSMLIGRTLFETALNVINSGRLIHYILPRPTPGPSSTHQEAPPPRKEERRLEIPDSDDESDGLSPSPPPPSPPPAAPITGDSSAQPDPTESAPASTGIYAFVPLPAPNARRAPIPITTLLSSWFCSCPSFTALSLGASYPVIPPFPDGFPGEEEGGWSEFDQVRGVFKWGGYYGVGGERKVDGCEHLVAAALIEGCPGLGKGRVQERIAKRGEVAGLMTGRSLNL